MTIFTRIVHCHLFSFLSIEINRISIIDFVPVKKMSRRLNRGSAIVAGKQAILKKPSKTDFNHFFSK